MSKLNVKDTYFSAPLNTASRKFVWFLWSGKSFEFLCLCFGLGLEPRIFIKLLKIPVLVLRRKVNSQRHSNLPSSTTWVSTEFKEISVDTYTDKIVLRGDSRFINHDPVCTIEESLKGSEAVSRTSAENTSVDFSINKTNRLVVLNYSSSAVSRNKFQASTTPTNTSIKNTGVILQKSCFKQKLQGRTTVVDRKYEYLQWFLVDSVSRSSAYHSSADHSRKGWGAICQVISTRDNGQ